MRKYLSTSVLVMGLAGPWTSMLVAEESPMIELTVPHSVDRGKAVLVQVTTGTLPRGARLTLSSENGEIIGAVAPFPPGGRTNTATVPVPRSAMVDGRVRLRLEVIEPGAPPRPPRPSEVEHLELFVEPQSE